jgi:5S rRNA maturation endonuclease (ribonuclease M5)
LDSLSETRGITFSLNQAFLDPFASFGGDFNGDNVTELVLSADNSANVYLLYGGAHLHSQTVNATSSFKGIHFLLPGPTFVYSSYPVEMGGDFNNDGLADLLIGDPTKSLIYLIYGQKTTTTTTNTPQLIHVPGNFTPGTSSVAGMIHGTTINGSGLTIGRVMSLGGDLNGDGFDDLVIAAETAPTVYVLLGRSSLLTKATTVKLTKTSNSHGIVITGPASTTANSLSTTSFGVSLSCSGDLNNDGYSELVIGDPNWPQAPGLNGFGPGRVYVFFGGPGRFTSDINIATTPLTASQGFYVTNTLGSTTMGLGLSIGMGGDWNKDGFDDLVMGTFADRAYLLLGSSNNKLKTLDVVTNSSSFTHFNDTHSTFRSGSSNDAVSFGSAASIGADINNDGVDDILIGTPNHNPAGVAFVFYGNKTLKSSGRGNVLTVNSQDPGSISLEDGFGIYSAPNSGGFQHFGSAVKLAAHSKIRSSKVKNTVMVAGDVNGDKLSDMLITSTAAAPKASVTVIYGIGSSSSSVQKNIFFGSQIPSFQPTISFRPTTRSPNMNSEGGGDDFLSSSSGTGSSTTIIIIGTTVGIGGLALIIAVILWLNPYSIRQKIGLSGHNSVFPLGEEGEKSPVIITDVFLSHDWGTDQRERSNHSRVSRINDFLKAKGLITWFDSDRMEGDIRSKMTDGIEHTKCIVVFITDNYRKKVNQSDNRDNCRYEFKYAFAQKGAEKMISVVMEERMRNTRTWQGELGGALGDFLYIDMVSDETEVFERQCEELYQNIDKVLKAIATAAVEKK